MATTGWFSGGCPSEPRTASPKAKMPPSEATSQYPRRRGWRPCPRWAGSGRCAALGAEEPGVAEGEDAAVGGHQPVASAVAAWGPCPRLGRSGAAPPRAVERGAPEGEHCRRRRPPSSTPARWRPGCGLAASVGPRPAVVAPGAAGRTARRAAAATAAACAEAARTDSREAQCGDGPAPSRGPDDGCGDLRGSRAAAEDLSESTAGEWSARQRRKAGTGPPDASRARVMSRRPGASRQ